ncbi:sugar phosphate isomerase/epimerase family protein [Paenibacillus humicola]|uniref:sugar phosphate isomerase/epimerase family protein n=1 Tax=Paenibacillus humicola TaxID=3110540 RepID=UPI00237AD44B|nr:sugar phosphate isomerase/epimerase family protein [Paenibacillus humicola]
MRKAVNDWAFRRFWPLERWMAEAREAGFTAVECNAGPEPESYLKPGMTGGELDAVRRSADEAGVEIASLSTAQLNEWRLTSGSRDERAKSENLIRFMIEAAHRLGARTVLVVPGMVTPDTGYDEAYARAMDSLRRLAAEASAAGVVIGVENVPGNRFLLSPLEFRRFIDEADSPALRVYLDIGNVLPLGFPEQWIRLMAGRLAAVQAKDMREGAGALPLLAGDVNWPAVAAALKETGFAGTVTATPPAFLHYPRQVMRDTASQLAAILVE